MVLDKGSDKTNHRDLIPNSRFFDNHLLIDPVAALLERDDLGYRDLRKAVVRSSLLGRGSVLADTFSRAAHSDLG